VDSDRLDPGETMRGGLVTKARASFGRLERASSVFLRSAGTRERKIPYRPAYLTPLAIPY